MKLTSEDVEYRGVKKVQTKEKKTLYIITVEEEDGTHHEIFSTTDPCLLKGDVVKIVFNNIRGKLYFEKVI